MPSVLGVAHTAPGFPVPAGACDCHVHVFGAAGQYRFADSRTFTPSPVTVDDLVEFHQALGVDRAVIVQASPQGTDNACLTDTLLALRARGREARGVAVVDDGIERAALQALHEAGVRGLRLNLQTFGISSPQVAIDRLRATARTAATMGWHVQVYTHLGVLQQVADTIASLGVVVVVDHFGLAHASAGVEQAGFGSLLDLVKSGAVYVKLSAPYRIVENASGRDGDAIVRAFIDCRLDRMLWGTDWPHTHLPPGVPRVRNTIEPLMPVDDGHQFNIFARWTKPDERQAILVDNPARLYGFEPTGHSAL